MTEYAVKIIPRLLSMRKKTFFSVSKSHTQRGSQSVKNAREKLSCLGTFKETGELIHYAAFGWKAEYTLVPDRLYSDTVICSLLQDRLDQLRKKTHSNELWESLFALFQNQVCANQGAVKMEIPPLPSMRDFSHDGWLCTFTITTVLTAAGNVISSKLGSFCRGRLYGPARLAVRTVHRSKNHTCQASLPEQS
jgi:hypothetical protein